MDVAAAILIACGVVVGGLMATWGLKGEHIPKGLAILHGIFVASGLILLLIYALTTDSHHRHWDSITIFIVAATGGFYMLTRDLRMKGIPPLAADRSRTARAGRARLDYDPSARIGEVRTKFQMSNFECQIGKIRDPLRFDI